MQITQDISSLEFGSVKKFVSMGKKYLFLGKN